VTKETQLTPKHDMTAPKMTRVAVRVPRTTLDQINNWVDTLGVRRSHFLGIALVAGVRSLMRASALETSPVGESVPRQSAAASGKEPAPAASGPETVDDQALIETVTALRDELARLQAEVSALRGEPENQQSPEQRP
jgi:hypothetical protein